MRLPTLDEQALGPLAIRMAYTQVMTRSLIQSWTMPGSDGQPLYGNTHLPATAQPRGVAIICHGFKGYKDYGFFPALASQLAQQGLVAHRFNFSHSGMTNHLDTFARPDLFEKDTWNKQVADLQAVAAAAASSLPGHDIAASLPQIWLGHSRGGVTTLLTAGRAFASGQGRTPHAIIALASVDTCCRMDEHEKAAMLQDGYAEAPSSRTRQRLRVDKQWLEEQLQDPAAHDLPALIARIPCPMLILHGQEDDAVQPEAADNIAQAAAASSNVTRVILPEANHTFNAPNPLPADSPLPKQTRQMFDHVTRFIDDILPADAS